MSQQQQFIVKHFLQEKAQSRSCRGVDYYPLFISIDANDQKTSIRSQMDEYLMPYLGDLEVSLGKDREIMNLVTRGYFSLELFSQISSVQSFPLTNLMEDELKLVESVIRYMKKSSGKNFTLDNLSQKYKLLSADISSVIDKNIKKKYYAELRKVFEMQLNDKKNPRAYKVSNFFLHFIRWDHDFYSIYENCYEIIPGELKFLENYYSVELNNSIKAYLSYQPRANVFKNLCGRQDMGEITRLTYLDWLDIRKLLLKEFDKIFGSRTAKDYMDILDSILNEEITKY